MLITLTASKATCDRCEVRAPMRPTSIRLDPTRRLALPLDPTSAFFAKEGTAIDGQGGFWQVETSERPDGWLPWPVASTDPSKGLCKSCGLAWQTARDKFLAPDTDDFAEEARIIETLAAPPPPPPVHPAPIPHARTLPRTTRRLGKEAPKPPEIEIKPIPGARPPQHYVPVTVAQKPPVPLSPQKAPVIAFATQASAPAQPVVSSRPMSMQPGGQVKSIQNVAPAGTHVTVSRGAAAPPAPVRTSPVPFAHVEENVAPTHLREAILPATINSTPIAGPVSADQRDRMITKSIGPGSGILETP